MEVSMFDVPESDNTILAIDPGDTTGIALVDAVTGELVTGYEAYTTRQVVETVRLCWLRPVHVVIEDFIGAGPRTKEATHVLKLIGNIQAAATLGDLVWDEQVPQMRLPFVDTARTRAGKGISRHIIDAYAHALARIAILEGANVDPNDR
jgi:hypothetical protein